MLDLTRLEKIRRPGNKTIARCPACAEGGADRMGNHLVIFPDGKFACAAHPDDADHRRRIFALVGISDHTQDPARDREWREQRERARCEENARRSLIATARQRRREIVARHAWLPEDVWEDSPQRIDCQLVESDPRHFLTSLFADDALLWTGATHHSGQEGKHAHHWQACATWQDALPATIGPMTTPATWQPGAASRTASAVLTAPYTVLDFDGFDGRKPETPAQLQQHLHDSLALIRWVRERLHWQLAAILWTGGKSLHAWFHAPGVEALTALRTISTTLGMDPGLIGRPEHPCRLPGQPHQKTGNPSRVMWLGV